MSKQTGTRSKGNDAPGLYFLAGLEVKGMDEPDVHLNEAETEELILVVETIIDAIKNGLMEGEYFEF